MSVEYTSPSSLIIALSLLIVFSKIKINNKISQKIVSFFAPLTYGIYLIHNHILVLKYIIKDNYSWLLKYSFFKLMTIEMFESLKIFILCSIIDYLRLLLFNILKMRQLSIVISNIFLEIGKAILLLIEKLNHIIFIK